MTNTFTGQLCFLVIFLWKNKTDQKIGWWVLFIWKKNSWEQHYDRKAAQYCQKLAKKPKNDTENTQKWPNINNKLYQQKQKVTKFCSESHRHRNRGIFGWFWVAKKAMIAEKAEIIAVNGILGCQTSTLKGVPSI